ncbi:hypothetical protein NC652_009224, partial [Populus alba x Populus x berolinensis]
NRAIKTQPRKIEKNRNINTKQRKDREKKTGYKPKKNIHREGENRRVTDTEGRIIPAIFCASSQETDIPTQFLHRKRRKSYEKFRGRRGQVGSRGKGRQNSFTTSAATNSKGKPEGAQEIDQIPGARERTACRIIRTKKKGKTGSRPADQVSNLFFLRLV